MSQRGYYDHSYGSTRQGESLLKMLLRPLLYVITLLASLLLALTLLAPIVSPDVWFVFPVLGLVAPAVYTVNLIIALIWIVRWRWRIALPTIFLLLLGVPKVPRFARVETQRDYATTSSRGVVKILSYNLRSHYRDDKQWSTEDVARYLDSIAPDIFCAQELRVDKFEKNLPSKFKAYNRAIHEDMGIYTKYPIIASSGGTTQGVERGEASKSMWADIRIGRDTLRLFNNHLASTMITTDDDMFLTSREFMVDTLREERLVDIVRRFKNSATHRAQHADSIKMIISNSPYAVIVCGDFNDTPMSYTYHTLVRGLNDSFVECGKGVSYTYRGFLNTLRIDYILGSSEVAFRRYIVDRDITLSDHLPIIAHFKLN